MGLGVHTKREQREEEKEDNTKAHTVRPSLPPTGDQV